MFRILSPKSATIKNNIMISATSQQDRPWLESRKNNQTKSNHNTETSPSMTQKCPLHHRRADHPVYLTITARLQPGRGLRRRVNRRLHFHAYPPAAMVTLARNDVALPRQLLPRRKRSLRQKNLRRIMAMVLLRVSAGGVSACKLRGKMTTPPLVVQPHVRRVR